MSSSGDGGYQGPIMTSPGPAIPGLPVAGADSTIGSPFDYGKFQNFLPDIKSTGPNDVATGLRPDMFQYRSPSGAMAPRDQLAQTIAAAPAAPASAPASAPAASGTNWGSLFSQMSPQDIATWQSTMNSAGRGDEAASALSTWRGG